VEYNVDVHIIKPVDLSKGNQRIFYDVVNRGNKGHGAFNDVGGNNPTTAADAGQSAPLPRLYAVMPVGKTRLVPPGSNRGARLPIALEPDGLVVENTIAGVIFDNAAGTIGLDCRRRTRPNRAKCFPQNTQFVGGLLVDRGYDQRVVSSTTTVWINRADPFLAPTTRGRVRVRLSGQDPRYRLDSPRRDIISFCVTAINGEPFMGDQIHYRPRVIPERTLLERIHLLGLQRGRNWPAGL
jgi:hypothetical protein